VCIYLSCYINVDIVKNIFGCRLWFYFSSTYLIWEGLLHHKNSVLLLTIFLCLVMISNQVFQSLGYHL
jgi:membrane-anchored protein YejM (alkaline phosphatase superfamily)